jgi:hypothetical protein
MVFPRIASGVLSCAIDHSKAGVSMSIYVKNDARRSLNYTVFMRMTSLELLFLMGVLKAGMATA